MLELKAKWTIEIYMYVKLVYYQINEIMQNIPSGRGWGLRTKSYTYGMFLWASTSLVLSANGQRRILYIRRVPASSGGSVEPE